MNKLKINARILLIIIISVFLIIPVVSVLSSKIFGIHEAYDDMQTDDTNTASTTDSSMTNTNKNIRMDRINMEGISYKAADGSEKVGGAGEHLYCMTGDITCKDGESPLTTDTNGATYTDANGKRHNSFQYSCGTNSFAECTNKMSSFSENKTSFFDSDNNETVLNGPTDDVFKGFLGPYDYVPMKIEDDYVYLYDNTGTSYTSSSACYLYGNCTGQVDHSNLDNVGAGDAAGNAVGDAAGNAIGDAAGNAIGDAVGDAAGNAVGGGSGGGSNCTATTNQNFKCLADNGAKPGDPLCCGQDGVLQDTKYNCPSEYPHCVGYKCGETWGKCSTTAAN